MFDLFREDVKKKGPSADGYGLISSLVLFFNVEKKTRFRDSFSCRKYCRTNLIGQRYHPHPRSQSTNEPLFCSPSLTDRVLGGRRPGSEQTPHHCPDQQNHHRGERQQNHPQ